MLIAALGFVLVPLLRSRSHDPRRSRKILTDSASNVAIFRAQKAEIEQDFAGALINADERDHALQELSMRIASEVKGDAASIDLVPIVSNVISRGVWVFATLAVIGIPLSAVLLYATLGSPQLIAKSALVAGAAAGKGTNSVAAPDASVASPEASDKQILAMVDS